MTWWIPAAISAASAVYSSISQSKQNSQQAAVNSYNANAQFNTNMANINSQTMLAGLNAQMALAAANINTAQIQKSVEFNVNQIRATTAYNNSLLDEQEASIWDTLDLDLQLLETQRAQERGAMVANQASSGVVIGEGSAADVIVNQKAQEALDALVIQHNADINISNIQNAKAQNLWQGEMQVLQTEWEGQMGIASTQANAALQAGSQIASAGISAVAGTYTANQSLYSGLQGADVQYSYNQSTISNNLVQGLFNAGSKAVTNYAKANPPTPSISTPGTSLTEE